MKWHVYLLFCFVCSAKANSLAGKTVVCTGVFPELGGGTGLNLGKDKLKALVTAFGGRVTGSVSGKTDILIVGKDPGYSKVSVARAKSVQLMSLKDLTGGLTGGFAIEDSRPMQIASFSSGYGANSQAYLASSDDLAVAQGKREPTPLIESSLKKGKSQKKTTSGKSINTKQIKAEAIADIITCDGCGVDCSEQSWFVETTQSDFCAACKPSLGYTPQRYGVDIVDTTKSDHDSTIVIAASGPVNKKQRKV